MSSSMHLQHIFAYSYMQYIMCIYDYICTIYRYILLYNAQYTFLVCDRILQQTTVSSAGGQGLLLRPWSGFGSLRASQIENAPQIRTAGRVPWII